MHWPFDNNYIVKDVYTIDELFDTFRAVYYTIFKLISLFDLIISLFRGIRSTLLLICFYVYSLSTN